MDLLLPFIFLLLTVIIIILSVKVVPQSSEYIIERFGRYQKTLKPGLNIIVPLIDNVSNRVSMKETVFNVNQQEIISKDNASVKVDGIAFFQVIDSKKSTYVVNDLYFALENLIMTNIRTVMGGIVLDDMLSNRAIINSKLLLVLDEATDPWGVKIVRVEIKDITPPKNLLDAMAQQMKAEREKRAVILKAEGIKQSEILKAEGEKKSQILAAEANKEKQSLEAEGYKQSQFRKAEARERSAKAEAIATEIVSAAISRGDIKAIHYFVAQQYIKTISQLASSNNSKTIMMPLETSNLISSVGGINELLKSMQT